MRLDSLSDLLTHELQDLYDAEQQILEALPKMIEAAEAEELKTAFEEHLVQTENHVTRLEEVAAELDIELTGKSCAGMEGLVSEGEEIIEESGNPEVKDAALIAAAQRVEHYEIAGYGCARTYAQLLEYEKAAKLLQETLDEEGETDHKLTELAQSGINTEARDQEIET